MFTVIIPVYNKAATLGKAIESVYAQHERAWEMVVVDDGSKDDFEAAIAPYASDPRIRIIRQQNSGVSVARNRGIELAREPYLAFLDADDEWLPNHLSEFKRMIEQEPGAGVYATGYRVQFAGGSYADKSCLVPDGATQRETDLFAHAYRNGGQDVLNTAGTCVWREAVRRCGGFEPGERIGEDTDFFLRIAAHYDVVMCNTVTAIYHRDLSTATNDEGFLNYDWVFQKREQALLADESIPAEKRLYIRYMLDHFRVHKARHYLMENRRRDAVAEMRRVRWDARRWRRILVTWGMVLVPSPILNAMYRRKREKEPM